MSKQQVDEIQAVDLLYLDQAILACQEQAAQMQDIDRQMMNVYIAGLRRVRDFAQTAQAHIAQLEAALNFNERAAKLSLKRKPFIVVANDEPYFMRVYAMIRSFEMEKGRWNDADEQAFRAALNPKQEEIPD